MSEAEEKTKVTVKIYGEEYVVKGYAKPDYIEGIGAYVDKKMQSHRAEKPPPVAHQGGRAGCSEHRR